VGQVAHHLANYLSYCQSSLLLHPHHLHTIHSKFMVVVLQVRSHPQTHQ
jgi:hypothetical protein